MMAVEVETIVYVPCGEGAVAEVSRGMSAVAVSRGTSGVAVVGHQTVFSRG